MIVSNTSPLRYLIAVRHAHLLHEVFGEILIPPAVLMELTHPSGREDVRQWFEQRPVWLKVQRLQSAPAEALVRRLDPGESEAIQLALETGSNYILIDERLARRSAVTLGLTVIGALGLLRESYLQGHLAEPLEVLEQMRSIGFRISRPLYRKFQRSLNE